MSNVTELPKVIRRAFLVSAAMPHDTDFEVKTLLDELEELVASLNIETGGKALVTIKKPTPALFLGSGRSEELVQRAKANGCQVIIFDNELTPGQQRNWEKLSNLYVIDRQEVILDIFAERAQTKEAVLQVELARMEYALPRLKRAWTHLSRQQGGSAMQRGVGETQLEVDQRMVRNRIAQLKKEFKEVIQHRDVQRKQRMKIPLPMAAIVGYTNAGKSSLLNCLTGSKILAEDKLFATLDPITRRFKLPSGQVLLMTDTVGFLRRLPHRLVEAFKATLEEAVVSEFLIHVADLSSPDLERHMQTTLKVMHELGAQDKTIITVFNKIDLNIDPILLATQKSQYPNACFISTKTKLGLNILIDKIEEILENNIVSVQLLIPYNRYDLIHKLYQVSTIQKEKRRDKGVYLQANIPKRILSVFEAYEIKRRE